MQKKTLVIGVLIGVVVGSIVGYVLGQTALPPAAETTQLGSLKALLGSKVVNDINIFVSGKITAISGRDLTVEDKGEKLVVTVGEQTNIFTAPAVPADSGKELTAPPQKIKFEELKVDDRISAVLSLSAEGKIDTTNIVVLPEGAVLPQP
jgi:hypothetical protein